METETRKIIAGDKFRYKVKAGRGPKEVITVTKNKGIFIEFATKDGEMITMKRADALALVPY